MTAATPPDPRVVALAREHERTARWVGELDALLRQLAADVATLARPAATGPGGAGDPGDGDDDPGVRSWLLADDPDQARADLAELAKWVAAVYLRYAGAALSGCWAWHPEPDAERSGDRSNLDLAVAVARRAYLDLELRLAVVVQRGLCDPVALLRALSRVVVCP